MAGSSVDRRPRRLYTSDMLRLALALLLLPSMLGAQTREIRAFWADGFNEGFKTREQVDLLLERLRKANCNAIFAQMRKSADAYYLSRYDPWAADNPERFDALAYLIERAHGQSPRIQVHAWLNTCAVGRSHGNPHHIALKHPEFLSLSDTGEDYDREATKIDPGHPDAADWTARVYLDVIRHYAVDGVHFDFVRYGTSDRKGNWGYNPVSVARFNAQMGRSGAPKYDDPAWMQWRRDQVTALVRKVYALGTAINPRVQISAATITWGPGPTNRREWNEKTAGMTRVFQDWRSWMEEGILDLNCQMSYYSEARYPEWFRQWITWGKDNQYRRWVVPSSGIWLNTLPDSLRQIEAIRKPTARGNRPAGVLLYSYQGTGVGPDGKARSYDQEFYDALSLPSAHAKTPPFAAPAEYPRMPWKVRPRYGTLYGYALAADGLRPMDGAQVVLSGATTRRQRADGTGFFAFVDVPPGVYSLTVQVRGVSRVVQRNIRVRAGESRSVPILGGTLPGRPIASRKQLDGLRDGAPVVVRHARVVGGTDIFPGRLLVTLESADTEAVMVLLAEPPVVPFQAGDGVALVATVRTVDGERILSEATARFVDVWTRRTPDPGNPQATVLTPSSLPPVKRLRGQVRDVRGDRFLLDGEQPAEVMLTGIKEPGVESLVSAIPPPAEGAFVEVEGLASSMNQADGGKLLRLRPRSPAEVRVVEPPFTHALLKGVRIALLPFRGGGSALPCSAEAEPGPARRAALTRATRESVHRP